MYDQIRLAGGIGSGLFEYYSIIHVMNEGKVA